MNKKYTIYDFLPRKELHKEISKTKHHLKIAKQNKTKDLEKHHIKHLKYLEDILKSRSPTEDKILD